MVGKLGIMAIVPTTLLLAISFFVMVTVRKIEKGALKSFGHILAALLCIIALLVFAIGMYVVSAGYCPIVNKMGRCGISKTHYKMMHRDMYKPMKGGMYHKGMMRK